MYKSTVSPPQPRLIKPYDQFLTDPVKGTPIGIVNPNGNGEDGQFYPIPLTAAQIASPTAAMLADTNVTYALNVAPYTRYASNGTTLVATGGEVYAGSFVTVPVGAAAQTVGSNDPNGTTLVFYGQLKVENTAGITFTDSAEVRAWP